MNENRGFTRRRLLGTLGALSLPAWFPRMAFATPADLFSQSDVLVCIFLRGGADGLNVVVPFGDPFYRANRPTLAIGEPAGGNGASAIDLDGYFGLHPALAPLRELYQEGVLAPIHAVGSTFNTHSHFDNMDYMERGTPGDKTLLSGWLGRHLQSLVNGNESPFRGVGFGDFIQTSLRGPIAATALSSIADFHVQGFDDDLDRFQATLAALYGGSTFLDVQARQTFDAVAALAAANPGQYEPANGATYSDSDFGNGMRQVAQIIKADIGMEIACIDLGGWDTHDAEGGADGQMAGILGDLAAGLQAFYADLSDRMGKVTVVTMTEFGRRALENASGGTDHGNASFMFVLGGSVNGGRVYGPWPTLAPEALTDPGDLAVTTDFRTVLAEIVGKRLGNPNLDQVFPGFAIPGLLGLCQSR